MASWVGLRGRCHTCRVPISIRYPLVELSTGVIFALVTWAWNGSAVAAAYCVLASAALAVSLIEYGGQRSPLVVAASGTGLALVIVGIGAGWHHHWRIVVGSLIGSAIAAVIYAVLRRRDPECIDPRGHGRSELLVAGCWVGGLGLGPAVVGACFWVGTYLVCMVGVWILSRQSPVSDRGAIVQGSSPPPPLFGTPLVSALGMALAASLIAGW